ncbi:hypothetical protein COW36_21455 [bacterium (Candidatus Blackallbacteria) CG17_big_fil_post_rev_8_21_14_2_50_48_46]|uniref:DUF202 domain-containing protein n=1 Tax=bacterium (Candidatus Blackallbacteria) CG17_big_fil_post_rev_8_21_14_2_50_48_46 TaxID=2014261 RepID=A0A2M7FZN2_9BACT|nr:MAG: hypothetical protein COW64_14755 [bacterium (Candidatus Blackallbacteria) CG18_big_fil_WC_8_21_14_2_50_49_26]PIW14606.1 MAG: hypothetical protein COW36_21455 [bacterium (Candidatus Blackallbacteria) CG17_big_fil_post_rev_8_21_14_2_50_48_46]PIW45657.1 MAG: hypothetical protein COW20_19285 [bacterium (Candidatus Blackallbacteria) CG13_big_fil_rev_8_21_14_2_50_49_14]
MSKKPSEYGELSLTDCLALDRTHLANERTALAYARTSLASILAGITLGKLFPDEMTFILLSVLLPTIGIVIGAIGLSRVFSYRKRIENYYSTPEKN